MPEVKYYEVTQTRKVKVQANSEVDAAAIATLAFNQNEGIKMPTAGATWGQTLGDIVVIDLNVTREMIG